MGRRLLLCMFLCFIPQSLRSGPPAQSDISLAKPTMKGIWKVSERQVKQVNEKLKQQGKGGSLPPASFVFDGEFLTLHLFSRKAWEWRSEDDHYKVRTKWIGADLYWLPPFGAWAKFAAFKDGRFVEEWENSGIVWEFARVTAGELKEYEKPLAKDRAPHDYSIGPRGERRAIEVER